MKSQVFRILICDDDQLFHLSLRRLLKDRFEVLSAYHSDEAIAILKNRKIDLILLDIQMRTGAEGLEAISKLKAIDEDLDVIMLSGLKDFGSLRKAMQLGAVDYIAKDAAPEEILHSLQRIQERRLLLQRQSQQNFETRKYHQSHSMIGQSATVQNLRKLAERLKSSSTTNVVIYGETGSGKEVVARMLRGSNPDGSLVPFVAVDSSTIHSQTAESILFGHEKGAFTGADKSRKGVFEEANGGILYFDEIANMSLEIQAKLLRAIQEKEITRLGSSRTIPLEFRVVAATNKKLEDLVKQGLFKEDLYQRISVVPIQIPPLRERREDIPLLISHFVESHQGSGGGQLDLRFSSQALEALSSYSWPGNIRELQNLVAYLFAVSPNSTIELEDLPPKFLTKTALAPRLEYSSLNEQISAFEKKILKETYEDLGGNISRMAAKLGVDRSHLYNKLRIYGIHEKKESAIQPAL